MATFDLHKNFAYSLIAVAPIPASSGTTFSVTAGEGTIFPAVPFNIVVWPAGANPSTTNAEVLRVTSKGTGDNWTATRTQESSSARAIALGDQVAAAITAKMLTDVEGESNLAIKSMVPGGRLTLTTALPVTTADVTAATTLYYALHTHNLLPLYDGSSLWVRRSFTELSIAVPATTSQMYDVFVYDNAGTATLELLAWTNDTTRATALVRQDGRWVKTGATTRLYLGSFRTTTVSGQTEDSAAKRFVWNNYNRVTRILLVREATTAWTYTTATFRQANAATTNQVAVVMGVVEAPVRVSVQAVAANGATGVQIAVSIGEDSTTTPVTGVLMQMAQSAAISVLAPISASLVRLPVAGYHTYVWLEHSVATNTTTWYGTAGIATVQTGITGLVEG